MKKIILIIVAMSGTTIFSEGNSLYKNSCVLVSMNDSPKSICLKVNDKHDRRERKLELKEVRCPKNG